MRRFLTTTLIFLLFGWVLSAQTLTLNAPSAVAKDQRFRVEFQADGHATSMKWPLEVEGLEILYGPQSSTMSSTQIINGKVSSSYTTTFSYTLIANREGTFTLPAGTCSCEGKTLTSHSATLKVLPADENTSQQSQGGGRGQSQQATQGKFNKGDVHLELSLNKTSAYEGEPIVATLKIFYRNCDLTNVSEVKLPDFKGFISQELEQGNQQRVTLEHYQGANYSMYPLAQWLLFPQSSGEQKIDASSLMASMQYVVVRRMGGFFDFPMESAEQVNVNLTAAGRSVNVKPLPAGKPSSYLGGVGEFSIKSELTSDHVRANDAVIYRITIEGTGNLKYIKDPQPEFPNDFEIYDPKSDMNASTTSQGVRGKRVIEYTIIPRFGGTYQIPPIQFSYFDTKSGQYRSLTTESYTLTVEKGANDGQSTGSNVSDFSGAQQERIRELGSDIRYIHPLDTGSLQSDQKPFFRTFGYWLFYLIPALLFIVLAIIYRRQLRLNSDLELKRTRKAGKVASKRLKEAAAALKADQTQQFYEALHKAMLGYVGDKLNIQLSELSTDNMRQQLLDRKVSEETVQQVIDLLQTCEFARYAPSGDATARTELYQKASDLLDILEVQIRK